MSTQNGLDRVLQDIEPEIAEMQAHLAEKKLTDSRKEINREHPVDHVAKLGDYATNLEARAETLTGEERDDALQKVSDARETYRRWETHRRGIIPLKDLGGVYEDADSRYDVIPTLFVPNREERVIEDLVTVYGFDETTAGKVVETIGPGQAEYLVINHPSADFKGDWPYLETMIADGLEGELVAVGYSVDLQKMSSSVGEEARFTSMHAFLRDAEIQSMRREDQLRGAPSSTDLVAHQHLGDGYRDRPTSAGDFWEHQNEAIARAQENLDEMLE